MLPGAAQRAQELLAKLFQNIIGINDRTMISQVMISEPEIIVV